MKILKYARIILYASIALFLFAFTDFPQTIRLKVLLIDMLPISKSDKIGMVNDLCVTSNAGYDCTGWFEDKLR